MARVKAKDHERLDDEHIEKAIAHLNEGGKKKEAYEILNIKPNSGRFDRILEEYYARKETEKRLRAANRGKPAQRHEIQAIVEGALNGEAIKSIADGLYRPVTFVNEVIERVGIPQKQTGNWWDNRFSTSIPDQCISESFEVGEIVWSHKYNGLAIVREVGNPTQIFVFEEFDPADNVYGLIKNSAATFGGKFANQPVHELGSLKHLEKHGIDVYKKYRASFPNWIQ